MVQYEIKVRGREELCNFQENFKTFLNGGS